MAKDKKAVGMTIANSGHRSLYSDAMKQMKRERKGPYAYKRHWSQVKTGGKKNGKG